MNRFLLLSLILLVIIIFQVFPEESSNNLRIGVVLIENPESDAGLDSLCETATDTIELTLRLVNKYNVERLDFLAPETYPERARLYFQGNNIDNAVYGQINRNDDGEYTFLIKGWEEVSNSIVIQTEKKADSVFDMFDIVDELTIEFIEELSGEEIGFGTVVFVNNGAEADYNIYVDGVYLGRNTEESEILFGKRTFKITSPGRFGDTLIETIDMDVNIDEEYNVVFSMDEAGPDLWPADSDGITSLGNLFVDAAPEGAEVFLDDQSIGFTPLILYGVGSGLYDMRVGKEYYLSASQVLRLEPNVDNTLSFDLGIDAEHPDIKSRLKDPVRTELITAGITAGQLAWLIGKVILVGGDGFNINYLDALILTPRYGHLLMGDTTTGTIISLVSLLGLTGMTGMYDPLLGTSMNDGDDLYSILLGLAVGSSVIYDLVGAPFAGAKWNANFLGRLKEDGISFDTKEEKDPFRYTIQTGGGGVIHGGVSWSPLWDWLYFEQLAGVSLTQYYDILEPALTTTTKILFYPLPNIMSLFNPYLGGLFILGSDFSSVNFAYGLASGFEISLPWLDIFLEADLSISNEFGTVPVTMALGVRL